MLYLNTLIVSFPALPVTFYFSRTDRPDVPLCPLTRLYPVELRSIYPDLQQGNTVFTSFDTPVEGFMPLPVDLNHPDNFFLAKRYYNSAILRFFRRRNILASVSFVGDTEIYLLTGTQTDNGYSFDIYDRYILRIRFNDHIRKPELLVSYARTTRILNHSLSALLAAEKTAPFGAGQESASVLTAVNRLLEKHPLRNNPDAVYLRLHRLAQLQNDSRRRKQADLPVNIDYSTFFPVLNRDLAAVLHITFDAPDTRRTNPYAHYLERIRSFVRRYIHTDDFQSVLSVADHFTQAEAMQIQEQAMLLRFGSNFDHKVPQHGLNNGPYQQPVYSNVHLLFIVPEGEQQTAGKLFTQLKNGYGTGTFPYAGLSKYIGIVPTTARAENFTYDASAADPAEQIRLSLFQRRLLFDDKSKVYLALYFSSVGKDDSDPEKHELYYRVKEQLLNYGIVSQCIDTRKMKEQWAADERSGRFGFVYSLQNISIAINAKLGGSPWVIATPPDRELIIGIGAFRTRDRREPYLGAAFMFSNTGAFNRYTYFRKHDIRLLAGAIEEAILNFRELFSNPSRLIIHYYKDMQRTEEQCITDMLLRLSLDIPVYIVHINETESEDVVVFDSDSTDTMPYSGTCVNLGNNTYLLSNNTRYIGTRYVDAFPFPVKIHITGRNLQTENATTIRLLIEQVYQFSRIYWKSVRQQNLPVTIMYPKMVAEILPHFRHEAAASDIPSDRLWFL